VSFRGQRKNLCGSQHWRDQRKRPPSGYGLIIISREDIVSSLLDPSNLALCRTHLGLPVTIEVSAATQIQQLRDAVAEVVAAWSRQLEGKPLIELRAVRMDADGSDTAEIISPADDWASLARSARMVIEAPAGRGKTTTLVQLAKRYSSTGGIALLVDLPGWVQSGPESSAVHFGNSALSVSRAQRGCVGATACAGAIFVPAQRME
jgi:hypothetical protein